MQVQSGNAPSAELLCLYTVWLAVSKMACFLQVMHKAVKNARAQAIISLISNPTP